MTGAALEAPQSANELYYARGAELDASRPLLTGDVIGDTEIAGVEDGPGLAMIIEHPCSMRLDGINLMPTLLACRVENATPPQGKQAWAGWYSYMHLPEIQDAGRAHLAVNFLKMGRIRTDELTERRMACLSPQGISLLMQRLTNFLTRVVVPTSDVEKAIANIIEEVDQLEEWSSAAVAAGQGSQVEEFMEFIRAPREGSTLQECFHRPSKASFARREIRKEIMRRFN